MLVKIIFLLHLTLSVQGEKIWKTKPIRKLGGIQRNKELRRPKKGGRNVIFRSQSLRIRRLFRYLPRVINFYGSATFDTWVLLTFLLFILKKFLLLLILAICRVIDGLLNEDINGNWNLTFFWIGQQFSGWLSMLVHSFPKPIRWLVCNPIHDFEGLLIYSRGISFPAYFKCYSTYILARIRNILNFMILLINIKNI